MAINIGIIGTGRISDRALVPAINETDGARFWSVLSRDESRAESFASRHGAVSPEPGYGRPDPFYQDPALDAVLIATPDRLHAEQGIKAARAGKHVLMEKPMVTNLEEGKELVRTCEEENVRLGVAYHLRWHAGHRKLVNRIHDEELGTLHHARVHWSFQAEDDSNWRASEEVGKWWALAGVGTHALDLIRWIMVPSCGEITDVESMIAHDYWESPNDETALVLCQFDSGATAEISCSVLYQSTPSFEVYGRNGNAIAEGTLGPYGRGSIHLLGKRLRYQHRNPYRGEIQDFVHAIQEKRPPEVDGEEGLRNVELLLTADP